MSSSSSLLVVSGTGVDSASNEEEAVTDEGKWPLLAPTKKGGGGGAKAGSQTSLLSLVRVPLELLTLFPLLIPVGTAIVPDLALLTLSKP